MYNLEKIYDRKMLLKIFHLQQITCSIREKTYNSRWKKFKVKENDEFLITKYFPINELSAKLRRWKYNFEANGET